MSKKVEGWRVPVAAVIRASMTTTNILWNIGSFFAYLPMLHSETSGNKASWPVRAWDDFVFDPLQKRHSRAKIRQVSFLQKHGLIDPDYASRLVRDHGSTSMNYGGKRPCDEVERILKYDQEGLWDLYEDTTAARMLGAIAKSYNPGNYDEEAGGTVFRPG